MRIFTALIFLLFLACAFSFRKPPAEGWTKLSKFDHQQDSFLLAPVTYDYPFLVRRDSSGRFYRFGDTPLTAEDTIPFPRTSCILFNGFESSSYQNNYELQYLTAMMRGDTLILTSGLGDSEWFADYVIKVKGKYFNSGCEPGYTGAAEDYLQSGLHYKTTKQLLQLDRSTYKAGDSIKGYLDCTFEMRRTKYWEHTNRMHGTFKTVIQADTTQ